MARGDVRVDMTICLVWWLNGKMAIALATKLQGVTDADELEDAGDILKIDQVRWMT